LSFFNLQTNLFDLEAYKRLQVRCAEAKIIIKQLHSDADYIEQLLAHKPDPANQVDGYTDEELLLSALADLNFDEYKTWLLNNPERQEWDGPDTNRIDPCTSQPY
jgi:hypothetical protein